MPIFSSIALMVSAASLSATPGARLKETVTDGNCPWWFTASGAVLGSNWVIALSGTSPPEAGWT